MNKRIKEWLFTINNVLFLMTLAIVFTILISPIIHQMDVQKYGLDSYSGLSSQQIKSEFARLSGYLWLWHREPLSLEYFPMSTTGVIHFAEVKVFVDLIQVVFIITTITFVVGSYQRLKKKEILFLKTMATSTFWVLLTFLLFGIVAFDKLFVLFHQIVFRNEYWIFSARTDPVILILPEAFFMHGFFAIIAFVFLFAGIAYLTYKNYIKQPKVLK